MNWRSLTALAVVSITFTLTGCMSMSSGNPNLTEDNVSKIVKGVTTRDEVVKLFGEPDSTSLLSDGRRLMIYQAAKTNDNSMAQYANPFFGFMPSHSTIKRQQKFLQIYVSAAGVVQDYEFSDKTTEQKTSTSVLGTQSQTTTTDNVGK